MSEDDRIVLSEGDGGKLTSKLIQDIFVNAYGNEKLNKMDDASEVKIGESRFAMTTDSYVIKPIFFPGGDIGKLSICGTVNDLATKGAKPVAISAGFILEEGFLKSDLSKIAESMRKTAKEVGVDIVTGDTKVVRKGEADGIFINTTGIGIIMDGYNVSSSFAKPGDDIIITGTIADHGISILNQRENLNFNPPIESDVTALSSIVVKLREFATDIHVMRDPTRGGVASAINEIAKSSKVNIEIFYNFPIKPQVKACCELLGLDPLYIANEGKMIIFSDPKRTRDIIQLINNKECAVIGKVLDTKYKEETPAVYLLTNIGSKRVLSLMDGTPLPRIC